ncbi:uncharacterized protein LOC143296616 [Babylonia areolata]|uniref:uncharacterized protein LOC143296616 n=1 Tax=Babylonia areolata TaxID=304850 RepID=UPI003FD3CC54
MEMRRTSIVFLFFVFVAVWGKGEGEVTETLRNRTLTKEDKDRLLQLWDEYGPDYSKFNEETQEFPCVPLAKSSSVPTSVHELRPGDIKVIGAMGDSLTAGSAIEATNILMVINQYRGLSWNGGGETTFEDQITVPNILKKYNPDLYGYATGNGDEESPRSMFNVAVAGSTSSDLVDQAQEMILRMRNDPRVDFENDWKVVTVLSGNNDLCDFCNKQDDINLEEFHEHVTAALDILHAQLPRTLVNLVEPLNMEIVTDLNKGLLCSTLHYVLCDCAAFPGNAEAELALIQEADLYQRAVEEIALSGRYDSRPDFTVVSQPFFNATYLPRLEDGQPDMSYFAPDCFHLSRKGQAAAASALWNNMIEPVHGKRTQWSPGEAIECPTEMTQKLAVACTKSEEDCLLVSLELVDRICPFAQPYFFTNLNSGSKGQGQERGQGQGQRMAVPPADTAELRGEEEDEEGEMRTNQNPFIITLHHPTSLSSPLWLAVVLSSSSLLSLVILKVVLKSCILVPKVILKVALMSCMLVPKGILKVTLMSCILAPKVVLKVALKSCILVPKVILKVALKSCILVPKVILKVALKSCILVPKVILKVALKSCILVPKVILKEALMSCMLVPKVILKEALMSCMLVPKVILKEALMSCILVPKVILKVALKSCLLVPKVILKVALKSCILVRKVILKVALKSCILVPKVILKVALKSCILVPKVILKVAL